MRISILGCGHVGLVTGVCFADRGHKVYCIDIDPKKIEMINRGKPPIFEPGLDELLEKNVKSGNLTGFLSKDFYSRRIPTDISFICVPTPSNKDGSTNLKFIKVVSKDLGVYIKSLKEHHVVAVKSTVAPGTVAGVVLPILEKYSGKKAGKDFGLCMNPEFLREGSAIEDFINTDKIVIGSIDERSGDLLEKLYESWKKDIPRIRTDLRTAEMIKYAQNAFLATKISFINEIANICHRCSIDAKNVAHAIGLDPRIGSKFLNFGVGYGGSCFPKDVKALISTSKKHGYNPVLLKSVEKINQKQALEILKMAGDVEGKTVSILGLAFKPDTDDIREAPSIKLINELKKHNVVIKTFDPKATENMKKLFPDIIYTDSPLECLKNSDICFVMTEWKEIRELKPKDFLSSMNTPVIIDGRRVYDPEEMRKYVVYKGIGYGLT
ncbi:MAG: UDP-glucose/GDP-mannose dehydrogenase family protein [Candidatus Aenigmarchaeota archaeon]|nr:UDP-glucose/GDP-mannose dehydrogenase family protein [Candidatus Aenigmarchaeota archaeon]